MPRSSNSKKPSKMASKLRQQESHPTPPNILVKALAGTGKTFTQITSVIWGLGSDNLWSKFLSEMQRLEDDPEFDIVPSPEQKSMWDAVALSRGQVRSVTYCAFNKAIVGEFHEKWGWMQSLLSEEQLSLQFNTVNSLGNRAVRRAYGNIKVDRNMAELLMGQIINKDRWDFRRTNPVASKAIPRLVELCKLNLTGWTRDNGFDADTIDSEALDALCSHYDVETNGSKQRIYEVVPQVLEASLNVEENGAIDFSDQNWLPVVQKLSVYQNDLLLIDEGQDLPRCKQEFCLMAGRRIVIVGDDHQAIYGFAGADVDSLPRMQKLLSHDDNELEPLYLTVTRRCGKAIVKEAQAIVPEFTAHPGNPEGEVRNSSIRSYVKQVYDGDMILCRCNAPLVIEALKFLKDGRKVIIRGRDFGASLCEFIKRMKATTLVELSQKMEEWLERETTKELAKKFPSEQHLLNISDKASCIHTFMEDQETVEDVIKQINLVFVGKQCPCCHKSFDEDLDRCPSCKTDTLPGFQWKVGPHLVTPEGILFSSVHRAKGLESDRVFILLKDAPMPHPMAKKAWEQQQEMNLKYVAITRAIHELIWVR